MGAGKKYTTTAKRHLDSLVEKNPKTNTTKVYPKEVKDSKKAILHHKILLKLQRYSLLEITLETGRSHQIRSQMAYIGSPIKGDLKYGAKRSNTDGGIHLHAKKVQFIHPVSKDSITINASLPDEKLWNECLKMI